MRPEHLMADKDLQFRSESAVAAPSGIKATIPNGPARSPTVDGAGAEGGRCAVDPAMEKARKRRGTLL